MARIITKELAKKIARKLGVTMLKSRGRAHDIGHVLFEDQIVAIISIRHGSDKDLGHDHLPRDLHISPHNTRLLGQCQLSKDEYFQLLRASGHIGPAEDVGEDEGG